VRSVIDPQGKKMGRSLKSAGFSRTAYLYFLHAFEVNRTLTLTAIITKSTDRQTDRQIDTRIHTHTHTHSQHSHSLTYKLTHIFTFDSLAFQCHAIYC
jgi:hypothetical protein